MRCLLTVVLMSCWSLAATAAAQFVPGGAPGIGLDQPVKQRWKVGVEIQAVGGPCNGLFGTVPVPKDWPEQQVKIVDEEISPYVRRVTYRDLDGVQQMLFAVPQLPPGETAKALVTFEITRTAIQPPADRESFVVPQNLPRDIRPYLGASPSIECRHPSIRAKADELTKGRSGGWAAVETIYDWVRDNVKFTNGKMQGAVATLRDKQGGRDDLTSLFIALCRAAKVPARTVFVPDNCYAEFYLESTDGKGQWFPCQVAGTREFGSLSDRRPILQKGDQFNLPEKKEPQRFVSEFLTGQGGRGAGVPDVRFVRSLLPGE
jgi:hypothetical protein